MASINTNLASCLFISSALILNGCSGSKDPEKNEVPVELKEENSGEGTSGEGTSGEGSSGEGSSGELVEIYPRQNITAVTVQWTDRSNNEDGFIVERSLGGEEAFETVSTVAANSTQFRDENLEAGNTYCYRISSFNQAGSTIAEVTCQWVESVIN